MAVIGPNGGCQKGQTGSHCPAIMAMLGSYTQYSGFDIQVYVSVALNFIAIMFVFIVIMFVCIAIMFVFITTVIAFIAIML